MAAVTGSAKDLTGKVIPLEFRRVSEEGAIYNLAQFPISQRETLVFTIKAQVAGIIAGGEGVVWFYIRGIIGVLLVILAIDLVVQGVKALSAQKKAAAAK